MARGCRATAKTAEGNPAQYSHGCCKLNAYNFLEDLPAPDIETPGSVAEVRFKNSRKDFFRCPDGIGVFAGDIVAVESSPGHDIGIVTLTGELARKQMRKRRLNPDAEDVKKLYRKARAMDVEKWIAAVEVEEPTLFKSRKIIAELNLDMKLTDVEYQGDKSKATFYYTAEDRVDFRELIKRLAETFQIRIEMRQIGARQEAARLGGIGSCGRELCCSTFLTAFSTVTTAAARVQQLPLNPQKLAGQCSKLKCCLNYEIDHYADTLRRFPHPEIRLQTRKATAIHQKSDIFKLIVWYSYENDTSNMMAIPLEKAHEIIRMNKAGKKPDTLEEFAQKLEKNVTFDNIVGQDDLKRFDNER